MSDSTSSPPQTPRPPSNAHEPSNPISHLIRQEIRLPGLGRPYSEFADDVGQALFNLIADYIVDHAKGKKNKLEMPPNPNDPPDPSHVDNCFLCIRHGVFGRIRKQNYSGRQASGLYFEPIDNEQAVTELERWIDFIVIDRTGSHSVSMSPAMAKTLIASSHFRHHLPSVDRIFEFALPVGYRAEATAERNDEQTDLPGTLTVENAETPETTPASASPATAVVPLSKSAKPAVMSAKVKLAFMRPGFGNYRQNNGERVFYYCNGIMKHYISLRDAKEVIKTLFSEFRFADDQSRVHATARLLTPYCQALMGWRKRSPLWVFTANKPRSGKDYLAMITPLVHSHYPIQDPPLEDDGEVKRRITAALVSGRRFMHFSNCRRDLDSPSLEAAVTAEYWNDRIIRSSAEATVPNEIIFSLSYNGEWHISNDLIARIRMIRLLNEKADSNARRFEMHHLHDLISVFDAGKDAPGSRANTKMCRRNVLAAVEALIRNWALTMRQGTRGRLLSSYPEWSRIVGGIMRSAELGDPCQPDRELTHKSYDNRAMDLLELITMIAKEASDKKFQTAEITTRFVEPNKAKFVELGQLHDRLGKKFNVEFGQILSDNSACPLVGPDAEYEIHKDKTLRPNHFSFSRRAYDKDDPDNVSDGDCFEDYLI